MMACVKGVQDRAVEAEDELMEVPGACPNPAPEKAGAGSAGSTNRQPASHGVRWGTTHPVIRTSPEMTTSTLRFSGPTREARIRLVHLLREFPQVSFRERAATEYEVSASDESALKELGRIPGWSLTGPG
jgi:hypothetical protein